MGTVYNPEYDVDLRFAFRYVVKLEFSPKKKKKLIFLFVLHSTIKIADAGNIAISGDNLEEFHTGS